MARTQQFVLRWSSTLVDPSSKSSASSIICPPGTTAEREDYSVDLVGVINLELGIIPDMSGLAHASLTQLALRESGSDGLLKTTARLKSHGDDDPIRHRHPGGFTLGRYFSTGRGYFCT